MASGFEIAPAYAVSPFVRPHGDGVVFSVVFYEPGEHGLQLIRREDGYAVYISLTDEYRVGRVYSVSVRPFDASRWLYRYRCGDRWMADPCAFGIEKTILRADRVRFEGEQENPDSTGSPEKPEVREVMACSCAPLRPCDLFAGAPERPLPPADWSLQLVYGLHVRGFTAAKPESFPGRGRFAGIAGMIPYLKSLGVTAVELMPVYTPLPGLHRKRAFRTMEEALGAYPVSPQGDPMRDMKERPNYWGFGRGLYLALRSLYGTQEEFAAMVHALHGDGIRVFLQIFFEKGVQVQEQISILSFYVRRFGIDGFRLLGDLPAPAAIAQEPSLADTALIFHDFPFEQMKESAEAARFLYREDIEDLLTGPADRARTARTGQTGRTPGAAVRLPSADYHNLITCSDDFQNLLRRFVKSDDYVMKDFLKLFLTVPEGHGQLRYVTNYEGFTLADTVSYSERHNEANGEFGLDGRADNYSWNCGEEGPTEDAQILALRRKQMRNFMTLLMLAQGTPMLRQGDECANSQGGNNNPYCQDNETSWVDWEETPEKKALTRFTARLAALRRDHPIFHSRTPFQYIDYLGIGHPDISLHGEEAWKPDLGAFSHSIGICFCENYVQNGDAARVGKGDAPQKNAGKESTGAQDPAAKNRARHRPAFLYLAVNMYWKELSLALPKLPPPYVWKVFLDTDSEEGFLEELITPPDQHRVDVPPRSIRMLRAVPDMEAVRRQRARERRESLPVSGALRRQLQKSTGKTVRNLPEDTAHAVRTLLPPRKRHSTTGLSDEAIGKTGRTDE